MSRLRILGAVSAMLGASCNAFSGARAGVRRHGRFGQLSVSEIMDGARLRNVKVATLDADLAAAFFKACCNMDVQRIGADECVYIGFGCDDFMLRLQAADSLPGGPLFGLSVAVPCVSEAARVATLLGGEVIRNMSNVTLIASLVPDEALDLPQPWFLRAVLRCPHTGLDVEFVQHPPDSALGAKRFIRHISFRVSDLDDSASFYTASMGMHLHRKR